MVILIAGETHTGKTLLAQKLLEAYCYPCLSLDHLKMGLIRSGQCALSPESDDVELTRYHREPPEHDHRGMLYPHWLGR